MTTGRTGGLVVRDGETDAAVRTATPWIGDAPPAYGLGLYLDVLRARLGLIALIVVLTVGAAAVFVSQTDKVYEAEADLLVTPIPGDNPNLFGLGLVSESGDPTRDAETLAQLITTPAVAERVRARLREERTAAALLKVVSAEPVAQSSIVTVTARANGARSASSLANAFAESAIAVRTERMQSLLDDVIPRIREQLDALPVTELGPRAALSGRLRDLETLRLLPDPTLHLENRAAPPASPVAPRPVLSIGAAFIASLVLAFGVVLGAHVLDTRVEREEDLRRYRLPIVGRIPGERGAGRLGRRGPLRPEQLSMPVRDAFHRLASSLAARTDESGRTIYVTGAGPADGKTTTSVNLAFALAALKEQVVVIEADTRQPSLAAMLDLAHPAGVTDVLAGRTALADALADAGHATTRVRMLVAEPGEEAPTPMSAEAAEKLLREAQARAGWVVVHGPALNYAPDTLPLAKRVASVLLVVRLRRTRVRDLADLAELLGQQGITPDGFIVVGGKPRAAYRWPR